MIKQAVCKTVAFGRCRFKVSVPLRSAHNRRPPDVVRPALPTICRSPSTGGGAVWKTVGRRKTGLQVRVLSAALSYLETCANWQAACPEHR